MRGTIASAGLIAALMLAACSGASSEPSEDNLKEALTRRGGMPEMAAKLVKGHCIPGDDGRYVCDYGLPDCPPYKPQCTRTRLHRARFAEVAGGWQYVGEVK